MKSGFFFIQQENETQKCFNPLERIIQTAVLYRSPISSISRLTKRKTRRKINMFHHKTKIFRRKIVRDNRSKQKV